MNRGQWIRKSTNGLNVIFIHGINSSEECWRHKNGSYWPNLLKDNSELADIGIYLFSYRTGINTGSYSLSDIVDSLKEYFFNLDDLDRSSGIIFVCHSMGGIVARRFLVNQHSNLIEIGLNKIGLFLVASPSLGCDYANMLSLISNFIGHTQASALQFSQNNVWLNDLDKDFMNLKVNKNLQIEGKELIEDLPLYGKRFIFIKKQIVQPFSGARYFGDSLKVEGSDHITIATPANSEAIQHRLLVRFIQDFKLVKKSQGSDNLQELGTKWHYTERNGWSGEWTREKDSNTFSVRLQHNNGGSFDGKAKITSFKDGTAELHRYTDNIDDFCRYKGKISSDGSSISGDAICPGGGFIFWSADIIEK